MTCEYLRTLGRELRTPTLLLRRQTRPVIILVKQSLLVPVRPVWILVTHRGVADPLPSVFVFCPLYDTFLFSFFGCHVRHGYMLLVLLIVGFQVCK